MKKYQYIAAVACMLVGAAGFGGIYVMNEVQEKQEESRNIEIGSLTEDDGEQIAEKEEKETEFVVDQVAELESEFSTENLANLEPQTIDMQVAEAEPEETEAEDFKQDTAVSKITEEKLHFEPSKGLVWPVEGSVLLDYSMDSTVYFPTLQQYKYNPAMVLAGKVNDKVYFIAKGKITNIETNEVTGCTVTQDIGDGYTAIYGQLKELNFEVGDMVQSGQVVGYISEPTKYYSVEGSNVYFQLLKNGVPVDPEEILP